MKTYEFTMKRGNVTIETFVYSEHGKDIENRFLNSADLVQLYTGYIYYGNTLLKEALKVSSS